MLSYVLALFFGIVAGTITGMLPGIHVNLVALLLLSLSGSVNTLLLAVFLLSTAVTHTFVDILPSIYLGAPEAETALGVLPGHRYLLQGRGHVAVQLTLVGSFGGLLLSLLLFPLFLIGVDRMYPFLQPHLGFFLLFVVVLLILRDEQRGWALLVFSCAGFLGWMTLRLPLQQPLFPLLSGLFGIATLLYSLQQQQTYPPQERARSFSLERKTVGKAITASTLSGFLTAMLPGLGSTQGALLGMFLVRKPGDHGFMILLGGVNTVNFVLSLATLFVLGKARNGAVVALQSLFPTLHLFHLFLFLTVLLVAGSAALSLTLFLGKGFSFLFQQLSYRVLVVSILVSLLLLTLILSGWLGVVVLFTATCVGMIPAVVKCSRSHAMGCLLVPVLLYFL